MKIDRLIIYLSWQCNMLCKHCWIFEDDSEDKIISMDLVDNILDEAKMLDVKSIKISGGEPLLNIEITEKIINFALENNINIVVETNGLLLNENFLKNIPHNVHFSISIDSTDEKIHDLFRGVKGAFQKTISNLKLLRKYDFPFNITFSFSNDNLSEIPKMITLSKKLGANSLKLNPIMLLGRANVNFKNEQKNWPYAISYDDLFQVYMNFCSKNKYGIPVDMMVPFSWYFIKLISHQDAGDFGVCDPSTIVSLLPNGEIGLCAEAKRSEKFEYGNLKNSSLHEALNNSKVWHHFKNNQEGKFEKGICSKCKVYNKCKGNCQVICDKENFSNPICEEMQKRNVFPKPLLNEIF